MTLSETIALVDDDRNILASVSMALESEGFRVLTFADGTEALSGLARQPVDLAILDIKMPRMDGMELLRRLRSAGNDVPVILLANKLDQVHRRGELAPWLRSNTGSGTDSPATNA